VSEHTEKEFYRINEVCQATDTQPYVLRFWESEFPQLGGGQRGGGPRVYRREDVALIRRIKQLLYDEQYTLDSARKQIETELNAVPTRSSAGRRPTPRPPVVEPPPAVAPAGSGPAPAAAAPAAAQPALFSPTRDDVVPRQRYDDAVDEIDRLRFEVKESERTRHRAETRLEEAQAALERERKRAERAVAALEELQRILS